MFWSLKTPSSDFPSSIPTTMYPTTIGVLTFLQRRPAAQPRRRANPRASAMKFGSLGMSSLSMSLHRLFFLQLNIALGKCSKRRLQLFYRTVVHPAQDILDQLFSVGVHTPNHVLTHACQRENDPAAVLPC